MKKKPLQLPRRKINRIFLQIDERMNHEAMK
jgi:hypothetical protein